MRALTTTSILFLSGSLLLSAGARAANPRVEQHQAERRAFIDGIKPNVSALITQPQEEWNGHVITTTKHGVRRSKLTSQSGHSVGSKRVSQSILTTSVDGKGKSFLRVKTDGLQAREQQTTTRDGDTTTLRSVLAYGQNHYEAKTITSLELPANPAAAGELAAAVPGILELPQPVLKKIFSGGAFLTRLSFRDASYGKVERKDRHQIEAGLESAPVSRELYLSVKEALAK
jgi:hypothetical protein